jgi:5-deoxy-glucuronate isomerase
MASDVGLFRRAPSSGSVRVDVTPENAGWGWTGLRVIHLAAGDSITIESEGNELLILPLSGSADVSCEAEDAHLIGRDNVFAAVSDFVYVGRDRRATITTVSGGHFAVPAAKAGRSLPFRYVPASDVRVELRGAGSASRQVNNFCTPETFEADRLIACEVLTPGGNWSSYPPHKHDEDTDIETALEEIYYFEVAEGPVGPGVGYQRAYGTDDRPLEVLEEVRTGDVVLIPHGWHGPSIAAPGYDLYYLNAMAGPGPERAWRICDDPAHGWVRQAWVGQALDPRVPQTRAR